MIIMKTAKEILEIKAQAIQKEIRKIEENTETLAQKVVNALEEQAQNKKALVTTLFVTVHTEYNHSLMYEYQYNSSFNKSGYTRSTAQYDFDTFKKILSDNGYRLTIDRDTLNGGTIPCKRLTISVEE